MSGTTVDDGLVALTAVFDAVKPTGWQVLDGGPGVEQPEDQFLYVGYSSDDTSDDVSGDFTVADAGMASNWERYTVTCELSQWVGDESIPTTRRSALAAYNTFLAALAADPQLGGVVAQARPTSFGLLQVVTGNGAVITVRFGVYIQAVK